MEALAYVVQLTIVITTNTVDIVEVHIIEIKGMNKACIICT